MRIEGIEILCEADMKRALRMNFHRVANEMGLSSKVVEKFEETIREDLKLVRQGRKSSGVVAARIYIIGLLLGEPRTQRKIALAAGCTVPTIGKYYQLMNSGGRAK